MKNIYFAFMLTFLSIQTSAQDYSPSFQKAFDPFLNLSRSISALRANSTAVKKTRSGSRLQYMTLRTLSLTGQDSTVYFYNGNWGYDPTSDYFRWLNTSNGGVFLNAEMELANDIANNYYTQFYDSSILYRDTTIPFSPKFYTGCHFDSLHRLIETEQHSDSNQYHLIQNKRTPQGVRISKLDSTNNFTYPNSSNFIYSYDVSGLLKKIAHWELQSGWPSTYIGFDSIQYNTNGFIDSVFTMENNIILPTPFLRRAQAIEYTPSGAIAKITRLGNQGTGSSANFINESSLTFDYDASNRLQSVTMHNFDTVNQVWIKEARNLHVYPNATAIHPDTTFVYYGDSVVFSNYMFYAHMYNSFDQITESILYYNMSGSVLTQSEQYFFYSNYTPNTTEDPDKISSSLQAYPNPATNQLHVRWKSSEAENGKVEILNLLGAQVFLGECSLQNQAEFTVDIASLSSGMYLLKVSAGNESRTIKFEKK
ncbi:MAG: T9SS type A sorting domain-containing protein [Chitinophagaceae bacterium]|nr:T9SS type A sorting domain-containing protein [Chitinophagaceae bacterium]